MNSAVAVCVLLVAGVALARPDGDQYTTRYDHINWNEVLENDKLFQAYVNCVLDKGKCTPEGHELKKNIPDALQNGCAKCTPRQKEGTRAVMKHLVNNKQEIWKELCAKYDPDNKYAHKYEKELREISA